MGERPPIAEAAYDRLAADYDDEVAASPYAVHLAVPGTTALVPDPAGARVLDAGCGTGLSAEWLHEEGATVVGLDVSAAMLAAARDRLGAAVPLVRTDLGSPLGFSSGSFDGVLSVLALDYVRDWTHAFAEFARVLRPGGWLVCTVAHPFDEFPLGDDENYFDIERRQKDWAVEVPYFRRPLSAIFDPLLAAGFRLETCSEPQPTEGFRAAWPERYGKESRSPVFLVVRGRLPA